VKKVSRVSQVGITAVFLLGRWNYWYFSGHLAMENGENGTY
jgi:hypothetical protein